MRTLGLDPIEVLVLPRLLALMIALPLLAFFADVLAPVRRRPDVRRSPSTSRRSSSSASSARRSTAAPSWSGSIKAPVFAFVIAMVGCYEGLSVGGSAESVGRMTTRSVVVGIFLVIVFDALFSILFSYVGV